MVSHLSCPVGQRRLERTVRGWEFKWPGQQALGAGAVPEGVSRASPLPDSVGASQWLRALWDPSRPGCPIMGRDREGTGEVADKHEVCMTVCSEGG